MAKLKLKKQSKRQPARLRYKIEKRVRDHNRKVRKEEKKHPKKKNKVIQVPNICPFKEDILKDCERLKKLKEEEKQKQREAAKERRRLQKEAGQNLEALVSSADLRDKLHSVLTPDTDKLASDVKKKDNSIKAYYREFKKVIEAADVILEVVDARDPFGTRCQQVEEAVREAPGNKRLVLIINKADLIPRDVLAKWLKYFKKTTPTLPFKASTQDQARKLGQRKFKYSEKMLTGSASVGADLVLTLLSNYCRNKGVKTSIRVGVVGLPNVGKSSIINSLKRSKACDIGSTPGVTRSVQEVQLTSKIKLLDSPGIVFSPGSDSSFCLRNAVRISSVADPITPANAILQRVAKQQMMEMYDVTEYDTPQEFYALKAARMGRFRKGGIPDVETAARSLLEDWNRGKIKYFSMPPEEDNTAHISSSIVANTAKEFDLENFESMECDVLTKIFEDSPKPAIQMDTATTDGGLLGDAIKVTMKSTKKGGGKSESKKKDPEMELEGNQQLNKVRKMQFKKERKQRMRKEVVAMQLSAGLETVSFAAKQEGEDNYDFDVDFKI